MTSFSVILLLSDCHLVSSLVGGQTEPCLCCMLPHFENKQSGRPVPYAAVLHGTASNNAHVHIYVCCSHELHMQSLIKKPQDILS